MLDMLHALSENHRTNIHCDLESSAETFDEFKLFTFQKPYKLREFIAQFLVLPETFYLVRQIYNLRNRFNFQYKINV